jgi:hypothetical protein
MQRDRILRTLSGSFKSTFETNAEFDLAKLYTCAKVMGNGQSFSATVLLPKTNPSLGKGVCAWDPSTCDQQGRKAFGKAIDNVPAS